MKNTFLILFTAFLLISLISCGKIKSAGWYEDYGVEKNNLYNPSSIPKLTKALGDNNSHVRLKAIHALSDIGFNDEIISKIEFMAKYDPNRTIKTVASNKVYFYKIYKKNVKTDPEIIKKIASNDPHARIDAIEKINRAGYNPDVYQSPLIYTTKYGNYYALVIGNKDYLMLQNLKTAGNDAKTVARLLENDYGFKVKLLLNARRSDIVLALSELRRSLTENDNLLIYYAGHGWLDKAADEGYWLPVDASNDNILQYISNSSVTSMIKAMRAKHILIVADSCYSGKLARGIHINFYRNANYLSGIANKTSRTVLCSGGLEPVLDSGGKDGHSVFASALIDELRGNKHIIDCTELFSRLRKKVILNADQTPEYSDIRKAGHDGGDFIFIRNIREKNK